MTVEHCGNCKHRYKLQKLDYSQGGCIHTNMEGYVCMVFADEGIASWMVGANDFEICEGYEPKAVS